VMAARASALTVGRARSGAAALAIEMHNINTK